MRKITTEKFIEKAILRVGCIKCAHNKLEHKWLNDIGVPETKFNRQVTLLFKKIRVDGLIGNTVYLFNGDYWHGNPKIYDKNQINKRNGKTFGELLENTILYEANLINYGYVVVSIWESDYINSLKKF